MTIDPSLRLGLTVAHDLSPRAIATWSPHVARTPRMLVPVQLDALVVRPGEARGFANLHMTPPATGTDVDAADLLPAPFTDLLPAGRAPGVYLHWALPDALTRGSQGADGQVAFPPVPDRWLILRLAPSSDPSRRAVRGWVLNAWDETPIAHDLATWVEPGVPTDQPPPTLNALGHGDFAWAAIYDNVENRLGFHDPLGDVSAGPVAYLVCGWFASTAYDPLGDPAVRSLADFHARIDTLRWKLATADLQQAVAHAQAHLKAAFDVGLYQPRGSFDLLGEPTTPRVNEAGEVATEGAFWPRATLYHGSVVGIGWPTPAWPGHPKGLLGGEVGGPPQPGAVQVALGNTAAEALAALVARRNAAPGEARVLEAFQLHALSELDAPDGRARLDQRLHAAAFGALVGPSTAEDQRQPGTPVTPTPAPPGSPGPGIFADRHPSEPVPPAPPPSVAPPPETRSTRFISALERAETQLAVGGLSAVLDGVAPPDEPPAVEPDRTVVVARSGARFFHPVDPVILVEGAHRSAKHGGDGRFSHDGSLACRLTGLHLAELSSLADARSGARLAVRGDDLLAGGVDSGSVPPECSDLLRELALLDPGSANAATQVLLPGATAAQRDALATTLTVEQTAWWAVRDRRVNQAPLLHHSGLAGVLPSPIAVTPPVRPWAPLFLEWQAQYLPSVQGIADWELGEIDFSPRAAPTPDRAIPLSGRSLLTAGAADNVAAAARRALDEAGRISSATTIDPDTVQRFTSSLARTLVDRLSTVRPPASGTRDELADVVSALESLDVLSGALDGVNTGLRGGFPGDGESHPDGGAPPGFVALRAGALRLTRLRLVDGFGQTLELSPQGVVMSEPLTAPEQPGLAQLPPRFTAPARVTLRYCDATGGDAEAGGDVSPVCGYLLPDHLDGELELFTAAGEGLGSVRPDPEAGVAWCDAPGRPATLRPGAPPGANRFLAGIAELLLRWGVADASSGGARETALAALLRIIDASLWAVDPYGHIGEEHLSLLIGHPVAVMRARLRVELREPIDPEAASRLAVPVRLGALAHWQDGLFGYFVDDDYSTLYCADRAVAAFAREVGPGRGFLQTITAVDDFYRTFADDLGAGAHGASPVGHPYVSPSEVIYVHPGQDVWLTLLVEPHALVHVTSGVVPRKDIGMRREWLVPGLDQLAPTFRFGPVLVDPRTIRMPVPGDLEGTWSWDHRADATTWTEQPVTHATAEARLAPDPPVAEEGWLRLTPRPPKQGGA